MAEIESLCTLPDDVIFHIYSFLDYNDINSCGGTCNRLKKLSHCDLVWKPFCRKYWCITNCPEHMSWRNVFIKWFRDYGRYIHVYRFIRKAWDQIEDYMDDRFPNIFESLQDGLSEEEIDLVEKKLQRCLPDDFRCVYRMHNGQRQNMADVGLFGALQVYNFFSDLHFLDLRSVCNVYGEIQQGYKGGQFSGCLGFARCMHSESLRYLALTNENGYTPGQVFFPVLNLSLSKGSQFDTTTCVFDDFIMSNSFLEYFTNFAKNLEDDVYPTVHGQMFRTMPNPAAKLQTKYVDVGVETCFCPVQSSIHPPEFNYAYRITLSMSSDAPPSAICQLESRHWIITDEKGREQRVNGPGVVGEYPIMKPDTEFSWISCTEFRTTYGSMGGHFTMRNLVTGITFELQCPTFHLKCPPYQTSEDRNVNMLTDKKEK